jgi:hypothetical protein
MFPKHTWHILTWYKSKTSPTVMRMKKIGLDTMPHAKIVVDKFHVLKHAYDALQSVRLDIKKIAQNNDHLIHIKPQRLD